MGGINNLFLISSLLADSLLFTEESLRFHRAYVTLVSQQAVFVVLLTVFFFFESIPSVSISVFLQVWRGELC